MLVFYHAPRSRSFRILWLLEELAVPYEKKVVSIRRGDGSGSSDEEYRAIHPHAKVPALVHDGVTIFETPAVALYLTDLFPEKGLGPRVGDPRRGPYLTWLAYYTGVVEPAMTAKNLKIEHRYGTFGWAPFDEVIGHLTRSVASAPYLLGEKFSAADVIVGGSLTFLMRFGIVPQKEPFVSYAARVTDRPAYRSAQAKDGA
jgi:glutathione S-transferase